MFMTDLQLTMACGPYDRTEALRTGVVKIEGVEGVIIGRALFDGHIDLAKAIKSFQC